MRVHARYLDDVCATWDDNSSTQMKKKYVIKALGGGKSEIIITAARADKLDCEPTSDGDKNKLMRRK